MIRKLSSTTSMKFTYDSKEEQKQHVDYMERYGYECIGQAENSHTPPPEKVLYGEFIPRT